MLVRGFILIASALSAAAMADGAASAPPLSDGIDVAIPAEVEPYVPANLRGYFLVFMVTPREPKPMSEELFVRHQAYIRRQIEAGVFKIVGPISNGGRLRGMKIVNAASIEDARKIAAGDPAVQEKVVDVEVYAVTLPSLATLRIEYPDKK